MKGECIKEKLKLGVSLAEKVAGKNLSLPILSSIVIEAKGQKFVLKATNLDVGLEYAVPGKVEEEGVAAVSGTLLASFLSALSGEEVIQMGVVGNGLSVANKRSSTILKTQSTEDFPVIPRVDAEATFTLPAELLTTGIRAVAYAASFSDIKPEIASIYIYTEPGEVVFVATDSFRLAEKRIQSQDIEVAIPILIPFKNASDIVRIFETVSGDVDVSVNKNQISLSSENIYFTSRLVAGVFPNYKQIMPASRKTSVSLQKRDLVQSLKLTSLFSDRLNQVTFKIAPSEQLCEVESHNQEMGENTTVLDATTEGEAIEISFNAKYILDCFQSISDESILLAFNGPGRPLTLRSGRDQSFTYLVMPMNR